VIGVLFFVIDILLLHYCVRYDRYFLCSGSEEDK
jgi:hypothetical protein